jgi:hypothetical protein
MRGRNTDSPHMREATPAHDNHDIWSTQRDPGPNLKGMVAHGVSQDPHHCTLSLQLGHQRRFTTTHPQSRPPRNGRRNGRGVEVPASHRSHDPLCLAAGLLSSGRFRASTRIVAW